MNLTVKVVFVLIALLQSTLEHDPSEVFLAH